MAGLIRQKLALGLMVLLAACSGGSEQPTANGAAKPIVLGFSQIGAESEWRTANTTSIQKIGRAHV